MQRDAPITYVPELDATLFTRRDDIHLHEKRTDVFSSHQPDGLMTRLMGTNMMRKDGIAHMAERRALFPALSPRTVQEHWKPIFTSACATTLKSLKQKQEIDLVRDFALPVSAQALIAITGLSEMTTDEMDTVSQAMIDGCANYAGNSQIEARCHAATSLIDRHIDRMLPNPPRLSALAVLKDAGQPLPSLRANIKLIISGGQNEPRDAIAGTLWALLAHPAQMEHLTSGRATPQNAFAEYARWMAPIGMSPRRVARRDTIGAITLAPEDRVFFMFSAAGRDPAHFDAPDHFDLTRDTQGAISFGAGPHFCAGAAAARCLITEVALPMILSDIPDLALAGDTRFHGWAFRGPTQVPVRRSSFSG